MRRLALATLFIALLWPARARAAIDLPVTVSGNGLVVRAEAGLESVAERVAASAPTVLTSIASDLRGLPAPRRVEIRLVVRSENLGRAAPAGRGAPEWASGVAYPDLGVVVVANRSGSELIDVDSVVAHELAHLALGAALGGREPRWLTEGFAYLHSSEWSLGRVSTLAGMAWTGDVIPFGDLDHRFPQRRSLTDRAYAQSYDFVVFLARRGRHADRRDDGDRWPFRDFLAQLASGASLDQASRSAYATPFRDLVDEWYDDLRSRYLLFPASLVGLSLWVVAAVLLVAGYLRKRRSNRATLARWEMEEAATEATGDGQPAG